MSLNIMNGIEVNEKLPTLNEWEVMDSSPDLVDAINNLLSIQQALAEVNYSAEAIHVLCHDPVFKQIISSNTSPEQAINMHLTKAYENLWQDWWHWGLAGQLFGMYLSSLKRIKKIFAKVEYTTFDYDKFDKWSARSIYLPSYSETVQLLKGLNIMHQGLVSFTKNPKAGIEPVVKGAHACGFNITVDYVVKKKYTVDWPSVVGSIVGAMVLSLIGRVVGMYLASDRGGTMLEKGFDPKRYKQCCADMSALIEKLPELQQAHANIKANPDIDDFYHKVRFAKSACKIYLHTVKNLGRGLASAYAPIK